jgi:hypothetical protein
MGTEVQGAVNGGGTRVMMAVAGANSITKILAVVATSPMTEPPPSTSQWKRMRLTNPSSSLPKIF